MPPQIPSEVLRQLEEHHRREQARIQRFGLVRPEIAVDFQGYKFVAVGTRLYYGKNWKFFHDFLLDYLPSVLGKEWGRGELAKPFDERHTIVQWRQRCIEYLNRQQPTAPGFYEVASNGFAAAYFALAYDLYLVEHNGRLDDDVLRRLKHPDQFQGARHELFAEATCLRAGFEIEREDERDRTKRHAEFAARHKKSSQQISVEAKSKHRPGVLGRPGTPEAELKHNIRFGSLINDAAAKNPAFPLVIFLDTNLPPAAAERFFGISPGKGPVLSKFVKGLIDRTGRTHGGMDPYVLLVLTNHPHHYGEGDNPDPRKHLLSIYSKLPKRPAVHPDAIMALH